MDVVAVESKCGRMGNRWIDFIFESCLKKVEESRDDIWLIKRLWAVLGNRTRLTSSFEVKASFKRVLDT
jgi:hypothetical protein